MGIEKNGRTWENMPAHWSELTEVIKIHVVRDAEHFFSHANEIERVLLTLARPTTTRRGRPALHDDNPLLAVSSRIEIQRVADLRSMKVPPKNHVHP